MGVTPGRPVSLAVDARSLRSEGVKVFLQTSTRVKSLAQEEESSDSRAQAVRVLSGLSKKFHSFALVELASRARSDPFGKVGGGIVWVASCVV